MNKAALGICCAGALLLATTSAQGQGTSYYGGPSPYHLVEYAAPSEHNTERSIRNSESPDREPDIATVARWEQSGFTAGSSRRTASLRERHYAAGSVSPVAYGVETAFTSGYEAVCHCQDCGTAACGCDSGSGCDSGGDCDSGCGCDSGCSCDSGSGCDSCGSGFCEACCCGGCLFGGCGEGEEPWRLFGETCCGVKIYGWLNGGYAVSEYEPVSRYLSPVGFDDRDTGQGNQAYVVIEEELTGCGLEIGGRADVFWGTDARFTEVPGLELHRDGTDKWSTEPFYRLSTPQFYGEIGYNGLSFMAGHFYTTIGYEVVTAPDNFFYSHAYTMQYGEPFTHTGALAKLNMADQLEIYGGIHNGWDNFNSTHQRVSFLGGMNYTSCSGRFWAAAALTYGDELNPSDAFTNRTLYSLVLGLNLGCKWQYVVQHDYGWQQDVSGDQAAEWYGLNQYLYYNMSDRVKFAVRAEWFRDDDGYRVTNNLDQTFEGNFYEVTLGLNWTPCCNLIIRPEARYDWFAGDGTPYNDGTRSGQYTFGIDGIFLF